LLVEKGGEKKDVGYEEGRIEFFFAKLIQVPGGKKKSGGGENAGRALGEKKGGRNNPGGGGALQPKKLEQKLGPLTGKGRRLDLGDPVSPNGKKGTSSEEDGGFCDKKVVPRGACKTTRRGATPKLVQHPATGRKEFLTRRARRARASVAFLGVSENIKTSKHQRGSLFSRKKQSVQRGKTSTSNDHLRRGKS